MIILLNGILNTYFSTIDFTSTENHNGIKITSDDSKTQIKLKFTDEIDLKQFKKLVNRLEISK